MLTGSRLERDDDGIVDASNQQIGHRLLRD
jgi:hypothetical protein